METNTTHPTVGTAKPKGRGGPKTITLDAKTLQRVASRLCLRPVDLPKVGKVVSNGSGCVIHLGNYEVELSPTKEVRSAVLLP